ncbi:MAG: hypothetical protein N3A38_03060 [Planctomycetota bacterium]|nr:hypothetical protein [Planctomycetota bacterium]
MRWERSLRKTCLVAFAVLSAAAFLGSSFFCWRAWSRCRGNARILGEGGVTAMSASDLRARAAAAEGQARALEARVASAATVLRELEKRQMPADRAAAARMQFDILNLAAGCGLEVEEVSPVSADGSALADGAKEPSGNAVAHGKTARPRMMLRCRAAFDRILEFFEKLPDLRWNAVPCAFEIRSEGASAAGTAEDGGEQPRGAQTGDTKPLLHMNVVLEL